MPRPFAILEHTATLSDPTRLRLLHLLEGQELTVSELVVATGLPQSTVSRHLRVLAEGDWVAAREDGTRNYYRAPIETLPAAARGLWSLLRQEVDSGGALVADRSRLERVLAARRSRSQEFFARTASEWDALRDQLYGPSFDFAALASLLDPGWQVGDLGCGTGRVAAALAPFVRRVVAVDVSGPMLSAARARLGAHANVEVREGALERLPIADASLDAATLVLALHHVAEPGRALGEARRVLRAGGRLCLVDTLPHGREELRRQLGHVWLGFSEPQLASLLAVAGFGQLRQVALPAPSAATGPPLFVAAAVAATDDTSASGGAVGAVRTRRKATAAKSAAGATKHRESSGARRPGSNRH